MLSEGMIKHEFVVQTLQWGLDKLRRLQLQQLSLMRGEIERRHFNWDDLYSGVANRMPGIIGSNGHYKIVIPVDKRLRFADMKQFKTGAKGPNAKVYNRPTWGVLLGRDDSVRTRLKEGLSDSLREELVGRLREALADKTAP